MNYCERNKLDTLAVIYTKFGIEIYGCKQNRISFKPVKVVGEYNVISSNVRLKKGGITNFPLRRFRTKRLYDYRRCATNNRTADVRAAYSKNGDMGAPERYHRTQLWEADVDVRDVQRVTKAIVTLKTNGFHTVRKH